MPYVIVTMLVISTGPTPMADDWIYTDAALTFAETGSIRISPISLPLSIFEAVYGGLFVSAVGDSWDAVILSSAVLAAVSGVALFDLVWRGTSSPVLSLLAVLTYLFTPVLFALNSTFMTDGHAIALAIIATALFSRALYRASPSYVLLVAGSLVATAAFLSRPSAALVVLGPIVFATKRRDWSIALTATAVPLAAGVTFLLTQHPIGARALLIEELSLPELSAMFRLIALTIAVIGLGLVAFAVAGIGVAWRRLTQSPRTVVWATVAASILILLVAPARLLDWLNPTGLYPIDTSIIGTRPDLFPWVNALPLVAVAAAVTCGLVVTASARRAPTIGEVSLAAMALGSIALTAISLASTNGTPLDRYVIVLLPSAIVFTALRTPRLEMSAAAAGLVVAVLVAIVSIGLTLDGRRLQGNVFDIASSLSDAGVVNVEELDAGAAWVSLVHGPSVTAESVTLPSGRSPWWHSVFAPEQDFRWVVSLDAGIPGCEIHRTRHRALFGPDVDIVVSDRACA